MFRFNNPDALLTLLLVGSAYALTRALEEARTAWLVLAGALIGFGFLTKMLQAFTVVPGLRRRLPACRAGVRLRRRVWQLLLSGAAMVAAAAWWVAIVALWPASSRPVHRRLAGQQHPEPDLRLQRLRPADRQRDRQRGRRPDVGQAGFGGGGPGGGSMWGPTGITRLFGAEMGTQIAWLLPAALFFLAVLLVGLWRTRRTDGRRAAVLIWGSWLVVTGAVFSFSQGIIHPYYNVVLAPAIGALVGIGVSWAWQRRDSLAYRLVLAAAVAGTAVWTFALLERTPNWHPTLRYAVLIVGFASAVLIVAGPLVWGTSSGARRAVLLVTLAARSPRRPLTRRRRHRRPTAAHCPPRVRPARSAGRVQDRAAASARARSAAAPPLAAASAGRAAAGGARRPPRRGHAERPARLAPRARRLLLPLGRRRRRLQQRRGHPARDRPARDGDRRLQRDRSVADACRLPAVRRAGEGALLHQPPEAAGSAAGSGSSSSSNAIASWVESNYTATTVGGMNVYDLSR